MKKKGIIIIAVIAAVVLLLGISLISTNNNLVSMETKVDAAFANIDTNLQRRADLIPNLVNTVKAYAAHESATFEKITKLRTRNYDAMSQNEKIEANQALGASLGSIVATAEAYPELKANENFRDLMKQLNGLEEDIANSRKYYNGCVREMNTSVESFPSNIIANSFHFEKYKMYEVDDAAERENVVVDFAPDEGPQTVAAGEAAAAAPKADEAPQTFPPQDTE